MVFSCFFFFISNIQFADARYQPKRQVQGILGNGWTISFKTEVDEIENGLKVADFVLIHHHESNKLIIVSVIIILQGKNLDNSEVHFMMGLKHIIDDDKQQFFWAIRNTSDLSKLSSMLEKPEFRGIKELPDTKPNSTDFHWVN